MFVVFFPGDNDKFRLDLFGVPCGNLIMILMHLRLRHSQLVTKRLFLSLGDDVELNDCAFLIIVALFYRFLIGIMGTGTYAFCVL